MVEATRAAFLAAKLPAARTQAESDELFRWWLKEFDPAHRKLVAAKKDLEDTQAAIKGRGTIAYVSQEKSDAAMAFILFRGEYDKRRDEVKPGTPALLPPMPAELPRNRLGLAQWLLRPEHPLTARVTVNRFWQEVFGTGLVKTAGEFGVGGDLPSHPELLDWLAVEFRENGWDVKRLFRMLVLSSTYRQSAAVDAAKAGKGSRQPAAVARAAVPHGRRNGPRLCPGGQRPAGARSWAGRASSRISPTACGRPWP